MSQIPTKLYDARMGIRTSELALSTIVHVRATSEGHARVIARQAAVRLYGGKLYDWKFESLEAVR